METKIIARVNNVEIIATSDEQLMPIRPICDALGIDADSQRKRIERDEILSSVAVMMTATGRDGKHYEMFAIPFRYIFGWLFSIDDARVNEAARPAVLRYKQECYNVLFDHFTARALFVEQKQMQIDRQLAIVEAARDNFSTAKHVMADAEAKLKKLRSLTMDDFDMERRQLKFDF